MIGDGTKGMQSQSLALAKSIGLKYKLIEVKPFWLSRIFPSFLAGRFSIPLSNNDKILLSHNARVILTCGARMAGISIGLKRIFKKKFNNLFNIHIQNPKLLIHNFDLLVIPEHDNISGDNIILSRGSLHEVNERSLKKFHEKISSKKLKEFKNHIVVLVGGSTKNQVITENRANDFIHEIKRIHKLFECKVVVLPSRRTPDFIISKLKDIGVDDFEMVESLNEFENPYPGIIFNSKLILVTTDSINMLSEATNSGKPVVVFDLLTPGIKKNRYISNLIYENKIAYSFKIQSSEINLKLNRTHENESDRIGKLIKEKLKNFKIIS